jgi:hypothetical protein
LTVALAELHKIPPCFGFLNNIIWKRPPVFSGRSFLLRVIAYRELSPMTIMLFFIKRTDLLDGPFEFRQSLFFDPERKRPFKKCQIHKANNVPYDGMRIIYSLEAGNSHFAKVWHVL